MRFQGLECFRTKTMMTATVSKNQTCFFSALWWCYWIMLLEIFSLKPMKVLFLKDDMDANPVVSWRKHHPGKTKKQVPEAWKTQRPVPKKQKHVTPKPDTIDMSARRLLSVVILFPWFSGVDWIHKRQILSSNTGTATHKPLGTVH